MLRWARRLPRTLQAKIMFYVYLIQSQKNAEIYIGSTSDLRARFIKHNSGTEKSTKSGCPWKLIYYEAYDKKAFALKRERNLKKYGKGLAMLKRRIGFMA